MNNLKYYTCQELLDLYPHLKLWGWTPNKIGTFYRCLLVDGKKFGKNKRTLITESSFNRLIEFVYLSVDDLQDRPEFMGYDEVMECTPQASFYRWTPTVIGVFCNSALLWGKRSQKESKHLVSRQSVQRLIKFTNQRFIDVSNLPID